MKNKRPGHNFPKQEVTTSRTSTELEGAKTKDGQVGVEASPLKMYEDYEPAIRKMVNKYPENMREDLTQEAYFGILAALKGNNNLEKVPNPYVLKCLHGCIFRYYVKHAANVTSPYGKALSEYKKYQYQNSDADVLEDEVSIFQDEDVEEVIVQVGMLPSKIRDVLRYELMGMNTTQIADALDLSRQQVHTRRRYGVFLLKQELNDGE